MIEFLSACATRPKAMYCWVHSLETGWKIKIYLQVSYWTCFRNNILQWVRKVDLAEVELRCNHNILFPTLQVALKLEWPFRDVSCEDTRAKSMCSHVDKYWIWAAFREKGNTCWFSCVKLRRFLRWKTQQRAVSRWLTLSAEGGIKCWTCRGWVTYHSIHFKVKSIRHKNNTPVLTDYIISLNLSKHIH